MTSIKPAINNIKRSTAGKYDINVKGGQSFFRQIDHEQGLIHLMRVNLLKRMERSINSFELTLKKLLGEVEALLEKLVEHGFRDIEELGIEDVETDDPALDDYLIKLQGQDAHQRHG